MKCAPGLALRSGQCAADRSVATAALSQLSACAADAGSAAQKVDYRKLNGTAAHDSDDAWEDAWEDASGLYYDEGNEGPQHTRRAAPKAADAAAHARRSGAGSAAAQIGAGAQSGAAAASGSLRDPRLQSGAAPGFDAVQVGPTAARSMQLLVPRCLPSGRAQARLAALLGPCA